MSEKYPEETLIKSIKFIMKTNKQQSDILGRMTARHTFAIRKVVEILIKENFTGTSNELEQLIIPSRNRLNPKYNLKQETDLNYSDVKWCAFKALEMWRSYNYDLAKWEKRREIVSEKVLIKMLAMTEMDHNGLVILNETSLDEAIENFSALRINRRLQKNKPSLPFSSRKYKNKKIPMRFMYNANMLGFGFQNDKLLLRISTLRKRKPLSIELEYGEFQEKELEFCRVTGGQVIKNLQKKRWEFIASVRKDTPDFQDNDIRQKKAILGVDLGIVTDATVVVLIEGEKIRKERFYFIKEPLLRRKKFNIQRRKQILQNLVEKTSGNERKQVLHELKHLNSSYVKVSNEACHRITKRIAFIAKDYLECGYDVQVAIGRLTGLKRSISKGDGKSRKFRGRINKFPYQKISEFIQYKCREIGVKKRNIRNIRERGTSKTCHKCDSQNTIRTTQAAFKCLECGLQYNADANGAINIALRFWSKNACSKCLSLQTSTKDLGIIHCSECNATIPYAENRKANSEIVKLIFLPRESFEFEELSQWLNSQEIGDSLSRNDSAGTQGVHLKVEEVRKENSSS